MTNKPREKGLCWWEEKDEDTISKTLNRLMRNIVIEEGEAKSYKDFKLHANIAILASLIKFDKIDSQEIKRRIIYTSVFHLRKLEKRNLNGLLSILNRNLKKRFARQIEEWIVIFPINLSQGSLRNKRWFTVSDIKLKISNWPKIRKELDITPWEEKAKRDFPEDPIVFQSPFNPLKVIINGRDYVEAFRKAEEAYDLLRLAINWQHIGLRKQIRFFSGRSTPLVPIPPSPSYGVFSNNGDFKNLFYSERPAHEYQSTNLRSDQYNLMKAFLNYMSNKGELYSTRDLVIRAFRLYNIALDTSNWMTVFLGLWQVLEFVTYKSTGDKGFSMREVQKRIRTHFNKNNEFLNHLLDLAYNQRNSLVHVGEFTDTGEEDVQHIKIIVENVLLSLISLEKICPTWESLVIYYKNAAADDKILSERARVIRAIQRRQRRVI